MSEEIKLDLRVCRACGKPKNDDEFGVNNTYKDGRSPKCRQCIRDGVKMRDDLKTTLPKRSFLNKDSLKCTSCGSIKNKSDFCKDRSVPLGYEYRCKQCKYEEDRIKRLKNLNRELNKKVELIEGEIWKDIPGYEGLYQVSNMGRVMSIPRITISKDGTEKLIKKKILSSKPVCHKYVTVILRKGGKGISHRVHRLVMLAFEGESDLPVDHINEIRDDNRLSNLRYCTPRENTHYSSLNKESISEFVGVSYLSKGKRWVATIYIQKKSYTVGLFDTEIEAHQAYQKALKDWEEHQKLPDYKVRVPSSKCKGVSYRKKRDRWDVSIKINKKHYNLGTYVTEEEACKARKVAEENYSNKGILPNYINPNLTSKYKYVTKHQEKWQAESPKINGKSKYLGLFKTELEAAKAVKEFLELDELLER